MSADELKVTLSYEIISDHNGIMTVAFFCNDRLSNIVAGESYDMLHRLEKAF